MGGDFIMIAPEGWYDMGFDWITQNTPLSFALIENYIITRNFGEFETIFRDYSLFPEGMQTLTNIKLIDGQYLWATFQ